MKIRLARKILSQRDRSLWNGPVALYVVSGHGHQKVAEAHRKLRRSKKQRDIQSTEILNMFINHFKLWRTM